VSFQACPENRKSLDVGNTQGLKMGGSVDSRNRKKKWSAKEDLPKINT
jgi:hypothetical protein